MKPIFFLNGDFVARDDAKISIENTGLNRAFGIFDLFLSRGGKPTFLDDYLERFHNSQQFLNLSRLIPGDDIRHIITSLQSRNQFDTSTFKLLLLGEGPDGSPIYHPHFSVINLPVDLSTRPEGINVITFPYVREHASIKSLNYFTSFSLQKKKTEFQAGEVVFCDDHSVSEASRSNIFMIVNGKVVTPARNILHGITRKHVLKSIEGRFPYEIRDIQMSELRKAEEVFLTSTTKEVMPVLKIDGHPVGNGVPGPLTAVIQREFQDYIAQYLG